MKLLYTFFACLLFGFSMNAQNGLEHIIVEKYYVSDINDKTVDEDGGELPDISVTYRVYVDMLPGYIFQAAFGTPEHELKIATSTKFFNNEDRGARFPTYSRSQAQNNTVMLDSWLSVGAALKDYIGVLKEKDDSVNTIVNADDVLQNTHPEAGIPLTLQDGAISGASEAVTVVGFFDTDLSVLDDANEGSAPTIISTRDGAWSSLNGSRGADTTENIVLIGQFTTNGVFEFELNIQIRNQQTLGVEKYVARDAGENELLFEDLIHIDSLGLGVATHDLVSLSDKVDVFPNPTHGSLTFAIDEGISFEQGESHYSLMKMDGTSCLSGKITDRQMSIDASELAAGIYLLWLYLDDQHQGVKKIVRIP